MTSEDCRLLLEIIQIPGHPPELSDSVKLLLTGARGHVYEIDPALMSIY